MNIHKLKEKKMWQNEPSKGQIHVLRIILATFW